MVTQDYRSQNSSRASRPRNVSMNGANYAGHPDDVWEDVEVRRSISPASSAPRRRGRRARAEFVASQPSSTRKQQPPQSTRRRHRVEYSDRDSSVEEIAPLFPHLPPPMELPIQNQTAEVAEVAKEYATLIFGYTVDVVADAFHFIRRAFSFALGIAILLFVLSVMTSRLLSFVKPVCSIPVVSSMIPFCHLDVFKTPPTHTSAGRPVRWADYPKLVDLQTKTFDQLLDESVGNKGLALEVMKAEMASNDLITLVKYSDLKSKDRIADRLSRFVDDARGTGKSLRSLGAKIYGAVDSITSVNDYALQTIEESKAPTSLAVRVLPFAFPDTNPTDEAVLDTFLASMDNIANHMARLRDEAEISMGHLLRLEEHLRVLHEETHWDNNALTAAQEDVLAELWTWLGGNRRKLRKMDLTLDLLKNVERYRKKALAHVVSTLQTLHNLDADMEELRTRVAMPDIVGDKIPVEIHIKSIKAGLDRLKEGQARATLRQEESTAKILEINA